MAKILIIRTSSFGDVALLVPVIFSVASRYPQDRFTVLTRKAFAPLFENLGFNINAIAFDPQKKHKGVLGLVRLIYRLNQGGYTHVADMHDVLRSKIIRKEFRLLGKKVAHIEKGRKNKLDMIASKDTKTPLKSTLERYQEVFDQLKFPAEMIFENFFEFSQRSLYPLRTVVSDKRGRWIGIAPFSKHDEKIYPLPKMENVVKELTKDPSNTIFLFGSGAKERDILQQWEEKYPKVKNISGKLNLDNELLLISYLDVMVSMDSANMHLASLVQVPVVSIWGATHPSLGFYGYKQDPNNAIQVDNLACRPCSVYGEIPCVREDYACLNQIKEETILKRIDNILNEKKEKETNNVVKFERKGFTPI